MVICIQMKSSIGLNQFIDSNCFESSKTNQLINSDCGSLARMESVAYGRDVSDVLFRNSN